MVKCRAKKTFMDKERFIAAIEAGGVEFALTEWILHCTEEEFLHLWPLMEQEHNEIVSKRD
jgi:hypothetical protein